MTYSLAGADVEVAGEEAACRGRLAGLVEAALRDAVLHGVEVELERVAHGRCRRVGAEDQAALADVDAVLGCGGDAEKQGEELEGHHFECARVVVLCSRFVVG